MKTNFQTFLAPIFYCTVEVEAKVQKIQMRPFWYNFQTQCSSFLFWLEVQKVGQKYNSSGPNGFHSALFSKRLFFLAIEVFISCLTDMDRLG